MRDPLGEAERLLERLSKKFDEAAVKVSIVDSVMVKASRGSVSVVQSWRDEDADVYIAKGGRIYVASTQLPSVERVIKAAETIVERLQPSKLYAPLPEPSGESCMKVDPQLEKSVEERDYAKLAALLGVDSGLDVSGMTMIYIVREALATSKGARLSRTVSGFEGYVRVFKEREVSGQWSWASTSLDEGLAKTAFEKAEGIAGECVSLPREPLGEGSYRLLFSPMTASQLLEYVASSALAGSVITGSSFLAGSKPGDAVASEALTIVSTPRDQDLPGYATFDDEGVAARDIAFIDGGVFKTLLHNTKTAKVLGGESTGNGGWIFPRLFNLEVKPGDLSEDEVFEALGSGVYITNNWYTRFQNFLEGTFSTVPRDAAFTVKGGRPVACVPGFKIRVEGSLKTMIKGVEALTRERYRIKWWEVETPTKSPYMIVSENGGLRVRRA
ncbi:MAG: TldD/PmbA family protein [Desulfurococcales archaeon]|nr:TldD/PmbA family protein [Desulfurococcales archaeon]